MTLFAYTSGNIDNLVAGESADMVDIAGPFSDIRTLVNGNVDTTNLAASAKPVTLLGAYHTVIGKATWSLDNLTSGVWLPSQSVAFQQGTNTFGPTSGPVFVVLNSTNYTITGLTSKLRLSITTATNATAPGISLTYGLYPVSAVGGTSSNMSVTTGTVVTGSTVTRTTPAANSTFTDVTSDFTFPATGLYIMGVSASGSQAANSLAYASARLELHYI